MKFGKIETLRFTDRYNVAPSVVSSLTGNSTFKAPDVSTLTSIIILTSGCRAFTEGITLSSNCTCKPCKFPYGIYNVTLPCTLQELSLLGRANKVHYFRAFLASAHSGYN